MRCQWIGRVFRLFRGKARALREGLKITGALPDGQGGGQENDRAAQGGMEAQQPRQKLAHVAIAGVHLVHDQDLASQPQQPQRLMAHRQDRE